MMYCTINDVVGTRLLQSVLMLQAILEETAVQNVNPRLVVLAVQSIDTSPNFCA